MTNMACMLCGEPLSPADGNRGKCQRCGQKESAPTILGAGGLDPNLLLSVALATLVSVGFYGLGPLLLLRNTPVYHLFCGHGWIPYACVFLFFCGAATLLLKLPLLRQQQSAFDLQLLPEAFDARINVEDTRRVLERIGRLTRQQRALLLVTRVRQAMLRLNQLGTAEKLDDLLRYRAEADESAMDSSYAPAKFVIWAIPVLGFVGTVLGISNGVASFSTLIQNASDLEGLRESLKGVTYGLGQAFETTMIALCMSLVLTLIMSWIQRREDRLLAAIDEYCMENLLHKISISAAPFTHNAINSLVKALGEMTEHWRQIRSTSIESKPESTPVKSTESARA